MMTPTFMRICKATKLNKQILSHVFLWQKKTHVWQNLLPKSLQLHKKENWPFRTWYSLQFCFQIIREDILSFQISRSNSAGWGATSWKSHKQLATGLLERKTSLGLYESKKTETFSSYGYMTDLITGRWESCLGLFAHWEHKKRGYE